MTRHGRAQCGARPVQVFCGPKEVCPTSGRLHWQGYIELKDKARLGKVKEVWAAPLLIWRCAAGRRQRP